MGGRGGAVKDAIDKIAAKMSAGKNVAFTGAGISTESGIPDYRSQGGIWDEFKPVYFDEFMSDRDARIEYWRQKAAMYDDLQKAKPNTAHLALANLYHQGRLAAVITQNIDGLHQESGIAPTMSLNSTATRGVYGACPATPSLRTMKPLNVSRPVIWPRNAHCGGYLKPDTISFGQAMPEVK